MANQGYADQGCILLYVGRSKSVGADLDCGQGCSPAVYETQCHCSSRMWLETLYKC